MKKQSLIILFFIFCFMYILNSMTPLLADDYFASFIWPEGVRINGLLPENAKRIESLAGIIETCVNYFLAWGGRIPGIVFRSLFLWQGKSLFNFVNAFMMVALATEIYWISHEGKITFNFNPSYLIWIFFSLWTFNVRFVDTCLWIAGACDYLWMLVLILIFLIPYVCNYFDPVIFNQSEKSFNLWMFFLGLLAGCSHETTNCWIILVLTYWLYENKKDRNLQFWKISGYVGFCLGYVLLILAPGNFSRLQLQQHSSHVVMTGALLESKLAELAIILFFHFILWYFIISFYIKFKRHKDRFQSKSTSLYLNLAKAFVFIACGSGFTMFFIPSNGLRTAFLNLAYLTIASALLFRVQDMNGISFINNAGKRFLCFIGGAYLIVTMFFSLWGNYINWDYWSDMVLYIKAESEKSLAVSLEIPPSPASHSNLWLYGSGLHLVPIPVVHDGTHEFNRMISIYYGIKGIKLENPALRKE